MALEEFVSVEVAVVGAGLVGAACALGCAQAGIEVVLIGATAGTPAHAAAGEAWDRRVYAISPGSRRFLESLKVWQQLDRARVAPVYDMRIFAAAREAGVGRARAGSLHFSSYQAASEALAWIVEHRELARVLNSAIGYQHGIRRVAADAEAFEEAPDRVHLRTSHERVEARLLVGADGARSRVRKHLEDTAALRTTIKAYDQTGVVANFQCGQPHGGTAFQWFTSDGVVALLPLPGEAVALVWSAPEQLALALLDTSAYELARRVETVAGGVLGTMTPISGASGFALEKLQTSTQVGPRTALVGDAAHVVHPLAGQGLNLGLQDAEVLCKALRQREPFRDCGDAILLRRYQRARAAPVMAMLRTTDGLQRLFLAEDTLSGIVRNAGMNLVDRIPVIKDALVRNAMG